MENEFMRLRAEKEANLRRFLTESDRFCLLSIDPHGYTFSDEALALAMPVPSSFHDHRVLGQTEVDAQTQVRLIDALFAKVEEDRPGSLMLLCFIPRHGIRAICGREVIDLLICFECGNTRVYGGETELDEDEYWWFSPPWQSTLFNSILVAASQPLAT